jgi:hypothetical protein
VLKSEIKPRTDYAFREKRVPGAPFQRVRVIEHIRGNKWKAEWIDPNPGLVHYVTTWSPVNWSAPGKSTRRFSKKSPRRSLSGACLLGMWKAHQDRA